jgi:TonB-dependent starch-binding outer membrane protein SusC
MRYKQILLLSCLLIAVLQSFAQTYTEVTGTVLSDKGEILPGVTVKATNTVKNTVQVVLTDGKGSFTFKQLVVGAKYNFDFTSIGFEAGELKGYTVKQKADNLLLIRLKIATSALNDVLVVGYGAMKKSKITSAIGTVKVDNVDQGSSFNAIKLLQGRVSGVNIITPAGTPGTAPIVMVRGLSSISGGSAPLYVVDGIPNEVFPNLDPNDVESMEVLKDASAAAIYGSRANSGVVIITTKSGAPGPTKVNITSRSGWGTIYHDIKMANSTQYSQVMQMAVDNYNEEKGTSLVFYKPANIQETNWVKDISRSSAATKMFDVNLSGGTEKTKFFTSFGYYDQQGILKTSDYSQYNFRLKLSHEINKYLKLNLNLSGSATPRRLIEEDNTSLKVLRNAREEEPWYSPYLADGSYKVNGTYIFRHNPVMEINEETWTRKTFESLGGASLDFTPIKGLKFTPSISAWGQLVDEKKKLTDKMAARAQSAGWGAIADDRNLGVRYVFDNILSYENSFKGLNYSLMAGHSFEKYTYDRFGAYSDNYKNGAFPSSSFDLINAGTNIYPSANIGYDAYALQSYLGRVSLDYKNRYLLNASVRRDGSSRFSKDSRFGTFPSVSLGWRMSKESFWTVNENILSDLKLRVSYGATGSMAGIGNYSSMALVKAGSSYNNQGGFILSQDAQHLTWEKAKQFDAGVDAELLNGRISFTADYFSQKTTDLLYNKPVYATTGFTTIPANIGTLQNQGLELAANSKILTGTFKWNLSANISFIHNKLLSLYNNTNMYVLPASGLEQIGGQMHALINGKPISAFYMLKQTGIYQHDEDVPTKLYAKGVRAGDVKYDDVNKDGDINDNDRQYVGKATPDFYGGITNNFSWKGFELNIFAQFSYGNKTMASWRGVNDEGTEHLGDAYSNVKIDNGQTAEEFYNVSEKAATTFWHGAGTSNSMPRPVRKGVFSGYTYNYNALPSTRYLEDGSYFKIKTVTLAYNFRHVKLFMTVDNLLTITKYSGYDPEQSFVTNPGDANYGVDFGLQAALRNYTFGINLNF